MERFIITTETCTMGFQEHVTINLLQPIYKQLNRHVIGFTNTKDSIHDILNIIEENSSLRVDFGWSFESSFFYKTIMDDCIKQIIPNFIDSIGCMTSDMRCSWLGFVPYNTFERAAYENLNMYELILFNNEIVDFQYNVVKFVTEHILYRQHALLRNNRYRFAVFKEVRKDPIALADKYHYYMKAINEVGLINSLPRELLEEHIGSHFLYYPDLYFELLEFSLLKGEVYE
jgi:hypothetical protein